MQYVTLQTSILECLLLNALRQTQTRQMTVQLLSHDREIDTHGQLYCVHKWAWAFDTISLNGFTGYKEQLVHLRGFTETSL